MLLLYVGCHQYSYYYITHLYLREGVIGVISTDILLYAGMGRARDRATKPRDYMLQVTAHSATAENIYIAELTFLSLLGTRKNI